MITIICIDASSAAPPDARLDEIIGQLTTINQRLTTMSDTETQLKTDIAALTTAVADTQAKATAILAQVQALKDQLANGTAVTAADLASLEAATQQLQGINSSLGAPATGTGGTTPTFNADDTTPNGSFMADGVTVRNTAGADPSHPLPGFNPALPLTS